MRRVMRTGFLGLAFAVTPVGVLPGLTQNVEQVKPVLEHVIPNMVDCMSLYFVAICLLNWPPLGHDRRYSTQLTISKRH